MNRSMAPDGRGLFAGLLVLLIWAPVPLGSNRSWSLGVLCIGVLLLLVASWFATVRRGRSAWAYVRPAWVPAAMLLAFAGLVWAQWWAGVPAAGSSTVLGTADRHQTLVYLVAAACHVGVFLLVLLLGTDERRLRLVMLALIGSALAQALVGIVLFSVRAQYQFLWNDIQHGAQTIGTFVNRNHLACYLYLGLSLGIGLLVGAIDEDAPKARRARDHAVSAMHFVMSHKMLLRLALVVMVVALVMTRSRMGNAAFFSSLVGLGVLVAVSRPALRRKALLLVFSLALVDMLVVGQWIGLDRLVSRIEGTAVERVNQRSEETVEARTEPARHTLPMIAAKPWFGWGGGSYYTAFPPFKSAGMSLYFDHAHNDYAQIAADTGLVGSALLAGAVLATLWRIRRLLASGESAQTRGIGYGVAMAIFCVVVHSWVDFNLQITANAFTFTAILGLAWAAPLRRGAREVVSVRVPRPIAG